MNVVLFCRVSTMSQDYQRQINELSDYCSKQGWTICHVFANKVSGAKKNEDRPEIIEMVKYVQEHDVDKVVCLEISRLGRNTLEALKVIQLLNENGVCLHIVNYNLDTLTNGKVNPVTSLICTILLEISSMERLTIAERMASGRNQYIANCRANNVKMGRPSTYRKSDETYREQYQKEIRLLRGGMSLRNASAITHTSVMTLRKLKAKFIA